jgi:RNA polymerase sigma-70 factor (ECF subfamily)
MKARNADLRLMKRVASRERDAATVLFDRFADEIFAFAARRLPATDAEDVLQETFKRALVSASTFRGGGSLRSWMYGIARHVLMERWRSRIDPKSVIDIMDLRPGPESLALGCEESQRLVWALERIPDEQAIVLELHRVDGLSHDEVAEILGIRPATSRKRMQRAVETLTQALESGAESDPDHGRFDSWRRSLLMRTLPEEHRS